jgi:type I restriction enzyme, R subunit
MIRAYANLADELDIAGYSAADIARIKRQRDDYLGLRETIRKASGESLDLKPFEADMRHLIDTYIEADEPRKISPFDGMGLLDLVVKTGIANAIASRLGGMKGNRDAIAEAIENNVRSRIIKEHLNDPAYFERMSALLDEIIAARKAKAIEYEEYLKRVAELAKRVDAGHDDDTPQILKQSPALRAIYHLLKQGGDGLLRVAEVRGEYATGVDPVLHLAQEIDTKVRSVKPNGWRGHQAKENIIKAALLPLLDNDIPAVERLFLVIKAQTEY